MTVEKAYELAMNEFKGQDLIVFRIAQLGNKYVFFTWSSNEKKDNKLGQSFRYVLTIDKTNGQKLYISTYDIVDSNEDFKVLKDL